MGKRVKSLGAVQWATPGTTPGPSESAMQQPPQAATRDPAGVAVNRG